MKFRVEYFVMSFRVDVRDFATYDEAVAVSKDWLTPGTYYHLFPLSEKAQ